MKNRLYLTRHGETEWNIESRCQGWQDSPLTETGKAQASALGVRVRALPITRIVCSPSPRAVRTAELISAGRLPIATDERLKEIGLGNWEGCRPAELRVQYNKDWEEYRLHPDRFQAVHGGETPKQLYQRVRDFLQDDTNWSDGVALAVTHGATLRMFHLLSNEMPLRMLWETPPSPQTSLSEIERVARGSGYAYRLHAYGDVGHLV